MQSLVLPFFHASLAECSTTVLQHPFPPHSSQGSQFSTHFSHEPLTPSPASTSSTHFPPHHFHPFNLSLSHDPLVSSLHNPQASILHCLPHDPLTPATIPIPILQFINLPPSSQQPFYLPTPCTRFPPHASNPQPSPFPIHFLPCEALPCSPSCARAGLLEGAPGQQQAG